MKCAFLLILFLKNLFIYGQSQKELEIKALKLEANKKYQEALRINAFIIFQDSVSTLGKRANNRIKKLITLITNDINGTWKLKQNLSKATSIKFTELIKIKNGNIYFIQIKNNTKTIIDVKKMHIIPYSSSKPYEYPRIKFENGEIWTLLLRNINNEKRLLWQQNINKSGGYISTKDDRSLIVDPLVKQKAFEKEIFTYYVLQKSQ
jgi:hypothetical protein